MSRPDRPSARVRVARGEVDVPWAGVRSRRPCAVPGLLVLATAAPERFPAAAARFGARLIAEHRLSVAEAQVAFAALQTLASPERDAGGEALCALLGRHYEIDAVRYLEEWLLRSP